MDRPLERSGFARRAWAAVVVMERRDTVDSLMMDGEAMERIASVEPAMMGGWKERTSGGWKAGRGELEEGIGKGYKI